MPVPILYNDFFLRVNASTLGTSFANYDGGGGWGIVNNTAQATPTNKAYAAFVAKMPVDGRVMAAESTINTNASWGVFLRGVAPYNTGTDNYYSAEISSGGSPTVQIYRTVNGTKTPLGSAVAITRVVGALLVLDVVGSILQSWYNNVLLTTTTDGTLTAGGNKSAGIVALTATQQVNLSRADARADQLWTLIPNEFDIIPEYHNEIVEYDSGFVQRNKIWVRPRRAMTVGYTALQDPDKNTLFSFFKQQQAGFTPFLIQDPTWVTNPIVQETFAIADGISTLYKVDVDKGTSITTFTDGVLDSAQPVISAALGIVIYATPPAGGSVLAYSAPYTAGVTPWYRVYFTKDTLTFTRKIPNFWAVKLDLIQEKTVLEGVVQ